MRMSDPVLPDCILRQLRVSPGDVNHQDIAFLRERVEQRDGPLVNLPFPFGSNVLSKSMASIFTLWLALSYYWWHVGWGERRTPTIKNYKSRKPAQIVLLIY